MSFDKAAIKRFNDQSSCAPPPTKYDPKTPQPHGSGAITFGQYSGRKDLKVTSDGFVTPSCKPRGRPTTAYSASTRSCSDSRLRKASRSKSGSSHSVQSDVDDTKSQAGDGESLSEKLLVEIEFWRKELEQEQGRTAQLHEENQCLVANSSFLQKHSEELQQRLTKLHEEMEETNLHKEQTSERIAKMELELEEQKRRTEDLLSTTNRLQTEEVTLKESLEQAQQKHCNEMKLLQDKIQEIVEKKAETEEKVKSLEDELEKERQKVSEEQSVIETEKGVLLQNIATMMDTINELSAKKGELEEQLQTLTVEMSSLKEAGEAHAIELQSLTNDVLEKKIKIQNLQQELEETKKAKEEELGKLKTDLKEFQIGKEQIEEQYHLLAAEVEELKKKAEDDSSIIQTLNMEFLEQRSKFLEMQCSFEEEKIQLEQQANLRIANLESELEEQKKFTDDIKSEADRLYAEELVIKKNLDQANQMHSSEILSLQEEIKEIVQKKEAKEARVKSLEDELETERQKLSQQQTTFETEKDSLNLAISSLKEAISELSTEKEDLEARERVLSAELSTLKETRETLTNEVQTLTEENAEKKTKMQALQQELENTQKAKEEELEMLKNSLSEFQTVKEQVEEQYQLLTAEIEELKTKANQDSCTIQKLNMALVDETSKYIELQSYFEDERVALTSKNSELKDKLSEVVSQYQKLEVELQGANAEYRRLKEESALQIELMEDDRKNHEAMNGILTAEKQRLLSECEELKKTISEKEGRMATIEAEISSLQENEKKLAELEEKLESERVKRAEEICATEKIIADLQSANGELQQQYLTLQDEVQQIKIKGLEDLACIEALKVQIQDTVERNRQIQSSSENENRILAGRNVELESNLSKTTASLEKMTEQYNTQRRQIGELLVKVDRLESESKKMEVANAQLSNEMKSSQAETDKLKKHLTKVLNELSTLQSNNAMLQDQFQNVSNENEKYQEKVSELQATLEAQQEQQKKLLLNDTERNNIIKALQALKQENQALRENVEEYKSVYGDYANLASHQNTRQKIKHIVNIKEENIKLREENSRLRQKNGELTEKLRQASSGTGSGPTSRRFDPSQAFKAPMKEPILRDEREVRGPDARSTFTVPKKTKPPTNLIDQSKNMSRQGMSFDIMFQEDKEN